MKYTNKQNLSQEIYDAIVERQSKYTPGNVDYSVTEILNPPRIVHLTKRHYDELEMDIVDVLDAWGGHLLHDALEKEETTARLKFEEEGWPTLSGAYDYYKDGLLKDYKRTSVWSYIFGSVQKKWEQQLNIYACLLRRNGQEVNTCGIEVFLKDWNKNEALRNKDYPKTPQFFVRMPLWSLKDQYVFLTNRLKLMEDTKAAFDENLPYCTTDDMWASPDKYAVMREGGKRALRLFDTPEDAEEFAEGGKKVFIEVRQGERTRCKKYCQCALFCNQWKEYVKETNGS